MYVWYGCMYGMDVCMVWMYVWVWMYGCTVLTSLAPQTYRLQKETKRLNLYAEYILRTYVFFFFFFLESIRLFHEGSLRL